MAVSSIATRSGQPATRQRQVFLSHASDDQDVVVWAAAQAEAMGFRAYLAERDVAAGTFLADKVNAAIGESDALLVVFTESAARSAYVHQEVGAACHAGKAVVALVDESLEMKSLGMLDGIEHIPFSPGDLAASSAPLIAALRGVLSQQRSAQPAPVWAVGAQSGLQLQFSAQLQLTSGQLIFLGVVVVVMAGLIYMTVRSSAGPGPVPGAGT